MLPWNKKYTLKQLFTEGGINPPTNPTKHEINNILRGTSKVTNGATIQAARLYVRGNERAGAPGKGTEPKTEQQRLVEFIEKNNLWYHETLDRSNEIDGGVEHLVYKVPGLKGFVVKTNNLIPYNSWDQYFTSLLLHNRFFPATSYELIGFKKTKAGSILPVVKQVYIRKKPNENTDVKDIESFLKHKGFIKVDPSFNAYRNDDLGIMIGDLHTGNVLTKENLLYFIDTIFYLDPTVWD